MTQPSSSTLFASAIPQPQLAAGKPPAKPAPGKPGHKPPPSDGKGKGKPVVRTQMVGEGPDDDLGYDPKKIPVEDI